MDFPNKRLEITGKGNPVFVSDLVNVTQSILTAMTALLGVGAADFCIVSGFTYTPGGPGSYSSGICYMNGVLYYFSGTLTEGYYLAPNITNYLSKPFDDSSTNYIYQIYYAVSSNTQVGGMPQFSGDMNSYRLNLKYLASLCATFVSLASFNAFAATCGIPTMLADKNTPDLTNYDFTLDNGTSRHSKDISAFVPVGTKFVLARVVITYSSSNYFINFFKTGYTGSYNMSTFGSTGAADDYKESWIPVDSNRTIGYFGSVGIVFTVTFGACM